MKTLLSLLFFSGFVIPAIACRCPEKPPVAEAVSAADTVFVGRAVKLSVAYRKIDESDRYHEVVECEFSIGAALKGVGADAKTVSLITSAYGTACGYPFKIGDEYLIYAKKEQSELATDVCMRTRPRYIIDEKQDFSDITKIKGDDAMQTEVPLIQKALKKK